MRLALSALAGLVVSLCFQLSLSAQDAPRLDADGEPLPPGAKFRLGTRQLRHRGEACSIVYSPDERSLAFISDSRRVVVMNASTGRVARLFTIKDEADGSIRRLYGLAFSPDGSEFAVAAEPDVIICESSTGKPLHTFKLGLEFFGTTNRNLLYSPNGKQIAVGHGVGYLLLDRTSGETVLEEHTKSEICGLAFSYDSKRLAICSADPNAKVWDLDQRKVVMTWSGTARQFATQPAFSPDGNWLALRSNGVVLLDVASGEVKQRLAVEGDRGIAEMTFSQDKKTFVAATIDGPVHVWNTADWSSKWTLKSNSWVVRGIALTRDGERLAVGDALHSIKMWDLESGKRLFDDAPSHDTAIQAVAFSPDGKTIVTGSYARRTHLWNARTGEHVRQLDTSASFLRFTGEGQELVTAATGLAQLRIWNARTGELMKEWNHDGATPHYVAMSADGASVATLHVMQVGKPIRWQLRLAKYPSLEPIGVAEGVGHGASAVAISPDGTLAAFPVLEAIYLVRTSDQQVIAELPGNGHRIDALSFTADGRFLVSGALNNTLRLLEVATRKEILTFDGHQRAIGAIALHPNTRVLASAESSENRGDEQEGPYQIRFWDMATGQQVAALSGHNEDVRSLAFSPDGSQLVAGLQDTTALVWDVPEAARTIKVVREPIAAGQTKAVWEALGSPDAQRGQAAVWRLVQDPDQALKLAAANLRPAEAPAKSAVAGLIEKLGSDDFKEREEASAAVVAYGDAILPQLREAMRTTKSAEVRVRCRQLLKDAGKIYPLDEQLLPLARAVQMLEAIGDDRAKALLTKLASGPKEAFLTKEAQAALARLPR